MSIIRFSTTTASSLTSRPTSSAHTVPPVAIRTGQFSRPCLSEALGSHVLIYIHKELALNDVRGALSALHYVLVDDKSRILATVKEV
jgi:hypothetical protein